MCALHFAWHVILSHTFHSSKCPITMLIKYPHLTSACYVISIHKSILKSAQITLPCFSAKHLNMTNSRAIVCSNVSARVWFYFVSTIPIYISHHHRTQTVLCGHIHHSETATMALPHGCPAAYTPDMMNYCAATTDRHFTREQSIFIFWEASTSIRRYALCVRKHVAGYRVVQTP